MHLMITHQLLKDNNMNDNIYNLTESILYSYCGDKITAKTCKKLLKLIKVTVNLKTCWSHNKAEVEYNNKLYIIEV